MFPVFLQDSDLTFDKEDVIKVTDQQDMKYFGELNGKVRVIRVIRVTAPQGLIV